MLKLFVDASARQRSEEAGLHQTNRPHLSTLHSELFLESCLLRFFLCLLRQNGDEIRRGACTRERGVCGVVRSNLFSIFGVKDSDPHTL